MALWPFRRRGSRWRGRTATAPVDTSDLGATGRGRQDRAAQRAQTDPAISTTTTGPPRARRDGSGKLQRRNRAYSFSPGRNDSLRVAKTRKESVPPLPSGPLRGVTSEVYGSQGGPSVSNDDFAVRVPTLHHDNSRNKRRAQPLPRKKSSKRRKEDHDREAEIKAMSQFMPVRPATDSWTAGRPVKQDSKRYRTGLNRSWDKPSSDISLPTPDSVHSSMSSDSEHVSWKISALDALSPRPTLRCASNPVYGPGPGSGPMRSQSTRRKVSDKGTIPEETLKAHKRVDTLADDLDASDLRELMERDKRRRERQKEKDQERIARRLARRAEKQRAEEAAAARNGTPPPSNLERGVLGRELPESGHEQTSAVVTSSRRRSSSDSPGKGKQPAKLDESITRERTPSPLDEFHRTDSIQPEPASLTNLPETEVQANPEELAARHSSSPKISPKIMEFIRSRKSRSTSPTHPGHEQAGVSSDSPVLARTDDGESTSRTSGSRSTRPWKSFFKWGRNRRSSGPSSFSNTSRDSMSASQAPPPVTYMVPRKSSSGVPKRTMSRFREDLPELPVSPPDSRVASPEDRPISTEPLPVIPDDVQMRYDTPTSGRRSQEAMRATPSSWHRDEIQPSPAPQSMSLASIDSEGSWLSGRVGRKRASSGMRSLSQYPPRTVSALSGGSEGQGSQHTDDDNLADDEYLNSVVPAHLHRGSTGEARPSSDEEEAEAEPKWGAIGQMPVMHHRETMRSREGLLLSFDDEKEFGKYSEGEEDQSPQQSPEQSPVQPQRATSVNLGKAHARNFSAGSAKLLEISPRPSGEHRRSGLIERGTQ
ncbi:Uu.00g052230.m01.CDS01 [Anthostomella pinea]|uniref:Uu.00g052230.m01.CDS01 n=1 Tax=Anthostomella pinea TaxID=933095 RepID=A0AAI8VXE7_9PEZI|nr:Uu.00g052230.m01.CDS01 [Anthostomella pinea]